MNHHLFSRNEVSRNEDPKRDDASLDVYLSLPRQEFIHNQSIYSVITTCDGSLTLAVRPLNDHFDPFVQERMHHPRGAWSETILVYGSALVELHRRGWPLRGCVVGLGLGYIELMCVADALKRGQPEIQLVSYESDPFLREGFRSWAQRGFAQEASIQALHHVLDQVAQFVAAHYDLPSDQLREATANLLNSGRFQLEGALTEALSTPKLPFSCVFYDAFSSKTNPFLWEEQFLFNFISGHCGGSSIYVSYAARGGLKRALIRSGFELQMMEGFGGKRESTRALRQL